MPGILSSVAQGSAFTCSATGRVWSRRLQNQKRGSPGSSLAIRSGSGPDPVPFRRTCLSKALDQASTPAKSIGKSGAHHFCWFDENLEREKLAKSYILDCFSRAGKEHGVKVCYLPIVRSKDGRLCHLEALAHWQDPKHGLLSPNVFVPALEEAHRISELDFYMLEEVCRRMQREAEAGKTPIPVSVNFCAEDFEQEGALEKTLGILEAYRIPVSAIVLEITEREIASAQDTFCEKIRQFREAGFAIWVDDFWKRLLLPERVWHISLRSHQAGHGVYQRSCREGSNGANRRIVRAILDCAADPGIHTLAEGVETKGQSAFLAATGCELQQGYYCGKPIPWESGAEEETFRLPRQRTDGEGSAVRGQRRQRDVRCHCNSNSVKACHTLPEGQGIKDLPSGRQCDHE